MKMLFLFLYIFLGLWVVSLSDEHEHISIPPISNTDSEVLLTLAGHKLPFALETVGVSFNHSDIELMSLSRSDKKDPKVCTPFINDTHFSIKASRDNQRITNSIFLVKRKPLVIKINLWVRLCLPQSSQGHHSKSKYKKHPLHAAKIRKNVELLQC